MFLLATVVVFAQETPATRDLRAANSSCDRVVQSILRGNYQRALMQLEGAPLHLRVQAELWESRPVWDQLVYPAMVRMFRFAQRAETRQQASAS